MVARGRVLPFILLVFLLAPLPAQGGEVTFGIAEVNGTQLYYEVVGEGQPLCWCMPAVVSSKKC